MKLGFEVDADVPVPVRRFGNVFHQCSSDRLTPYGSRLYVWLFFGRRTQDVANDTSSSQEQLYWAWTIFTMVSILIGKPGVIRKLNFDWVIFPPAPS